MDHLLTYMTFIPLAGMFVIMVLPRGSHELIRRVALAFRDADVADTADTELVKAFPGDTRLLESLVRGRLTWGRRASAVALLDACGGDTEETRNLRWLVGESGGAAPGTIALARTRSHTSGSTRSDNATFSACDGLPYTRSNSMLIAFNCVSCSTPSAVAISTSFCTAGIIAPASSLLTSSNWRLTHSS